MLEYGIRSAHQLLAYQQEEEESKARSPARTGSGTLRVEDGELPKLKVWVGRAVAEALADTGSVESFIRPKLIEDAGLETEMLEEGQSFICANGRRLPSQRQAKGVDWSSGG